MLQQASVVGKVFWDAVVFYINQEIQSGSATLEPQSLEIARDLIALQERGMIYHHNTSAFSEAEEYLFEHSILLEVTYESVLKRTRRFFHALVADWLILQSGDRVGEVAGQIANHLEKAEKYEQALVYLCQAAETAVSKYAIDDFRGIGKDSENSRTP